MSKPRGVRVQYLHKTYNMMNNKDACRSHAKQNLIQVHKHKQSRNKLQSYPKVQIAHWQYYPTILALRPRMSLGYHNLGITEVNGYRKVLVNTFGLALPYTNLWASSQVYVKLNISYNGLTMHQALVRAHGFQTKVSNLSPKSP